MQNELLRQLRAAVGMGGVTAMSELKPCPFCGGRPKTKTTRLRSVFYYVACGRCAAQTEAYAKKENAGWAWNRRTERMCRRVPLVGVDAIILHGWSKCSLCGVPHRPEHNFCPGCGAKIIMKEEIHDT